MSENASDQPADPFAERGRRVARDGSAYHPAYLGVAFVWVIALAAIMISPSLGSILKDFDTQVPAMTRGVIHTPWWMWLVLAVGVTAAQIWLAKLGRGNRAAFITNWLITALLVVAMMFFTLAAYQPLVNLVSSLA